MRKRCNVTTISSLPTLMKSLKKSLCYALANGNIKNIFWLMGKNTQKHLPGPVKHEKELRWYESSRATKGGRGGTGHPAGLPALYFLATGTNGRCNFLQTHKPQRSQLESACKPSSATWRGQEVHTSHNSDLGR